MDQCHHLKSSNTALFQQNVSTRSRNLVKNLSPDLMTSKSRILWACPSVVRTVFYLIAINHRLQLLQYTANNVHGDANVKIPLKFFEATEGRLPGYPPFDAEASVYASVFSIFILSTTAVWERN